MEITLQQFKSNVDLKLEALQKADAILRTDKDKLKVSAAEAIEQARGDYEVGIIPEEAFGYLVDRYLETYFR